MAPSRRKRKFRQLTLEQSMCRTDRNPVVIVENNRDDKATEQNPAPSEGSITRRLSPLLGSDRSESDDDFSEPDPDSSDEWLPSGSTGNSRSSSPDAAPRRHEGVQMMHPAEFPLLLVVRRRKVVYPAELTLLLAERRRKVLYQAEVARMTGIKPATCQLTSWSSS
ncbi:uncharacterized protein LOC115574397 isoform X3 [Sparus aurata]|uniref:uncharacterized protein LOC115574397 isoform X3 n=1 Tax=Sparus aurata TaxID=8175 RepID=UPI0011C1BFEC|nr:uncharacterized protein LOC115574397 isoform X3 [Sparus aurata]